MLLYALALAGVTALVAVGWLQRTCERGTYPSIVSGRLKIFLGVLVLAALFCSAVQFIVLLSNDYEASSAMLGQIQPRLRLHRNLARLFTLSAFQTAAFCAVLGALFIAAFAGSKHSIRRAADAWRVMYTAAAAIAFLA